MGLYERIKEVASEKGYSINRLEKELGFPRSSISKFNKNVPSTEKIQKISEFLGVSIVYLLDGPYERPYYFDPETARIAQQVFENSDLKLLFDAARDVKPENIRLAAEMLRRFKETNADG